MNNSNKFQVYAPLTKSQDNDSGSDVLTIQGVASTSNKDLSGDIIKPSAIESMKQQALTKNLHGDHHYGLFDGIIGTIKEVLDTDAETLSIKADILPTYSPIIKEMLDVGVNLGLSIGGYVTEYTPTKDNGWEIEDFDLMEISLTGMPANWDTFGTITTSKGLVKSKCLTGACLEIIKNNKENEPMAEENNTLTSEDVEAIVADKLNELMAEKQEEFINATIAEVKDRLKDIVEEEIADLKDENKGGDNPTEGEEDETKSCEGEEDEDSTKSISVEVAKAVAEQMGVFFEQVEKNRNPQPKIDQTEVETKSDDGTYSIEEIAKALSETNTSNIVADAMNKL